MENYVTYTRKKINDHLFLDPNTNNAVNKQTGGQIIFNETPYEIDGVFIAWIKYDGRRINPDELEYFRTLDAEFNFSICTEENINELLAELGVDETGDSLVSVHDFEFTDNRPVDDFPFK